MQAATVVLRTKDAGESFRETLDAILDQEPPPEELLVVDSGSRDGTLGLAKEAGARIVTLPAAEFTHARSTNLGFRESKTGIVVVLSQDATPADRGWLRTLLAPFAEARVSATFARQIARPGAYPLERWEISSAYPAPGEARPPGVVFSNVASAIRRGAWERRPFDERLLIAEDRAWALAAQAAGERVVYVPEAAVWHSHAYTLRALYRRAREEGRARVMMGERPMRLRSVPPGVLLLLWRDLHRLRREHDLGRFPGAIPYRWAQLWGIHRGGRSARPVPDRTKSAARPPGGRRAGSEDPGLPRETGG